MAGRQVPCFELRDADPARCRSGSSSATITPSLRKRRKFLIAAFEDALKDLCLTDREDPLTMMVAKMIIEFAKEGECDPARLRDAAVRSFR
jgi:hypothetical protein